MNALNHLAIIMDGNGRWAKKRGLVRTKGHEAGAAVVENLAQFCLKNGVKTLTLYAFSTENWRRPKKEVEFLLNLLEKFLISKREMFVKNEIKFCTIGDLEPFSASLKEKILALKNLTQNYEKLNFVLAINYGARDEIVRAAKKAAQSGDLSEKSLGECLDTAPFGDVDLLVRTGGERRLSNFLLWQASYAELVFTSTFFPDFTTDELGKIVENFRQIHRKFGGL